MCRHGAAGYRWGLGSSDEGCWHGAVLDLAPLPTGMRREDGEGKKKLVQFVGDTRPLWDPSERDPLGYRSPHTLLANLPLLGVSPKVGDVETTGAGCGVSLLCSWCLHLPGRTKTPAEVKLFYLLSEQCLSVGWDCNQCWWGRNASILPPSLLWRVVRNKDTGR